MKLSTILMFLFTLQISAGVYSQNTRLNLASKSYTIGDVIEAIESQSDFKIFYKTNQIDVHKQVNLTATEKTIGSVLDQALEGTEVRYRVLDKLIVLTSSKEVIQQQKVTGKISDIQSGESLPGVSIQIEGTNAGVVSDIDGNFSIDIPEANASGMLIFSYMGYLSEKVQLPVQSPLNIKMVPDIKSLNEVVVVGFGTQKKVNLTGAVGTVDAKDLESRPIQNTMQALQGLVPGLNISASGNGGELNASQSINIRGTGTVGQGSTGGPLILIDGMEGDPNSVSPQDIENISVLKDAAASSIYGSRAPFGVILITTKKGKSGKIQVNYNNSFRTSSPVLIPDMMDSYQFVNYFNDASKNGGGGAIFSDHVVQRVLDYKNGVLAANDVVEVGTGGKWNYDFTNGNVDWYSEYYKTWAPSQEHNISMNGGTENVNYYISGNYLDQTGLMRYGEDYFNRYATNVKIGSVLSKYVSLDYNARYTRNEYSRATYMDGGFYDNIARRARPIRPKYDPNGKLMADVNYIDALNNGGRRDQKQDWLIQQAKVTINPIKDWTIIAEMNYRNYTDFSHELGLKSYAYFTDGINKYQATTSIGNEYVYEFSYKANFYTPNIYSTYSKNIGKHNFKIMAGFQSELFTYNDLSASRNDLVSSQIDVINKTTNASPTITGQYQNWATAGFFGRLNYDFNEKYLFEANLRYDGTSRYREDLRWNLFPSFSAGWNIARESFWEPLTNYVGILKFRASYGQLGNQNTTGWYPTYSTIATGTANGNWIVNGVRPNTSSAPGLISSSLKWETVRSLNFGVDFGALRNRLTGSFDYFKRYTDDMIGPAPTLPATLGTSVPSINNTNLVTSGFELSIAWRDIIKDFSYGVQLTLADSRTKITKYNNETKSIAAINNYDSYLDGYYTNEIWGYTTIGIAKSDQEMTDYLTSLPNGGQNALGSNWAAGDIMYADVNGDGQISQGARTLNDHGDLKIIGNSTPRYAFGFNMDFAWKGFDFSMFWQGILKRDYFSTGLTYWGTTGAGQFWSTAFTEHLDYYRPEGHVLGANLDAFYPRPMFGGKNQNPQTRYLENAAYARMKNIQFGYTIPKNITSKIHIEKLRVFISGENLVTITKLAKSLDPESVGIGRQGGTVYPLSKVLSAGLSVNF